MIGLKQEFEATKAEAQEVSLRKKGLGGFFIFKNRESLVEKTIGRSVMHAGPDIAVRSGITGRF
jgi:hypothetical protein